MQRDLAAVLEAFVATHRGLRLGRLFGTPAAFAGRHVFAKLDRESLELRLGPMNLPAASEASGTPSAVRREAHERAQRASLPSRAAARPTARRSRAASWITISPTSPAAARLEMLLEQSARYVALS